jgi:hypothetical protein
MITNDGNIAQIYSNNKFSLNFSTSKISSVNLYASVVLLSRYFSIKAFSAPISKNSSADIEVKSSEFNKIDKLVAKLAQL